LTDEEIAQINYELTEDYFNTNRMNTMDKKTFLDKLNQLPPKEQKKVRERLAREKKLQEFGDAKEQKNRATKKAV